jgi:6-phosphogluconolactonase
MSQLAGLPELVVVPSGAVSGATAEHIADALAAAIAERGVAHWATTGGSAAPGIYAGLAASPLVERVAWDRVHTWFGDDRFVPFDHPLSNVLPMDATMLAEGAGDRVRLAAEHLHPWPIPEALAHGHGVDWIAARYAEELRGAVELDAAGTPVLDLVLLGVGPDGHILSVFPGSAAWDVADCCAGVPAPTHIEPHVERVTFHPRMVGAARRVLVVAAGASKAASFGRAWTGDDVRELPLRAARIPTATWILDEAAAAALPLG